MDGKCNKKLSTTVPATASTSVAVVGIGVRRRPVGFGSHRSAFKFDDAMRKEDIERLPLGVDRVMHESMSKAVGTFHKVEK